MNPIETLKHAPKWVWFATAGVGIGVVGIRIYRDRAAPAGTQTASTVGDGTTVGSTGSSPTPVITPPVIIGGDSGSSADTAGILTAVAGIFTPTIDDLTGLVGTTLNANSTDLNTFVSGVEGNNAQWLAALASGGLAPQPAASQPAVVNVNVPAPAAVQAATATTSPNAGTPAPCPASHPNRSSHGCYRCEKQSNGKYSHIYNNGSPTTGGNSTC